MSFTVSCSYWLSLTVSLSSIELLHISHCLLWLLAVSPSAMELLRVSHSLLWILSFSHCFYGPMVSLHVSHCFSLLLTVSHCLS